MPLRLPTGRGARLWFLALICLCAGIDARAQGAFANPAAPASGVIYVVRRGWHVDVGFAADTLEPPLERIARAFPGAKYLIFGFGDRHYLLARNGHGSGSVAAVWPGRALILVTALRSSPEAAFGAAHVIAVGATPQRLHAAQDFVARAIDGDGTSAGETPPVLAPGPYEGSEFFSARARYSAFHTCNTWVAEALQSAGFQIRSTGVIFAGQLWRRTRRAAAAG